MFSGASGSAVWLIALGAWLATRLSVTDGLVGLQRAADNVVAPLGSITAALSATALMATMGMNASGGTLCALTGIDSFRKVATSRAWRAITVVALAPIDGFTCTGPVPAHLTNGVDNCWAAGLLVSGLLYLLLCRSLDTSAEQCGNRGQPSGS